MLFFLQAKCRPIERCHSPGPNLLEHKKACTQEESSTPTELVWNPNMAAAPLFWHTNIAAMTSCENALWTLHSDTGSRRYQFRSQGRSSRLGMRLCLSMGTTKVFDGVILFRRRGGQEGAASQGALFLLSIEVEF